LKIAALMFFLIPLVEMIILIEVGSAIGALPTVLLVVFTAIVGVWLLRLEGIATLHRVQAKLANGQIPETELLEGIMLIVGGALLLTPGFATDFIGFVCLIPGLRRPLAAKIIQSTVFRSINVRTQFGQFGQNYNPGKNPNGNPNGTTIDGEFEQQPDNRQQLDQDRPPSE
jgi:UPF0716 protein FxsA